MNTEPDSDNAENCGDEEQKDGDVAEDTVENEKSDPFNVTNRTEETDDDHNDDDDDEDKDNKEEIADSALEVITKEYESNELVIIEDDEIKEENDKEVKIEEDNDEVKSQHDNENNQENDIECDDEFMKLFLTKIKLDDDTEEFVFSSGLRHSHFTLNGIRYSKSYFPINCHLCKCSTIKGKFTLQMHIQSKEHQQLLNGPPPNAKEYRAPLIQPYGIKYLVTPIKIYPGEVIKRITPEYYDRVLPIKECEFRPRPPKKIMKELKDDVIHDYNQKSPVIGLCYAFKMKIKRICLYYCTLCHTTLYGEPYQHFVGAGHQANYILRHFKQLHSKIAEQLEKSIQKSSIRREAVRSIFRVLYRKIELVRGLRKISIIETGAFIKSLKTLEKVCRNPVLQYHYDENSIGYDDNEIQDLIKKAINGEYIIDRDPITLRNANKLKEEKKLSLSSSQKIVGAEIKYQLPPTMSMNEFGETSMSRRKRRRGGRSRGGDKEDRPITKSSPLPDATHDVPANWDRYRRMLGATLDDLDAKYDKYEENPEKHPKYETEWKIFWRRRVQELERDKIDPERYNFKPEWENVWATLLKGFYESDITRRKYEIKKSLKLPLTKRSPSPIRRRHLVNKSTNSRSRSPPRLSSSTLQSHEYNYGSRRRTPSPVKDLYGKRARLRSLSPPSRYQQQQQQKRQPEQQSYSGYSQHHSASHDDYHRAHEKMYNRERRSRRSRSPITAPSSSSATRANERTLSASAEPVSVISILRLLTALEDQLGSLGPKAIDFLGKAILFEKENNGNSNQLLKDQEYYIFFMTSMEKLRGQIMTNIVPPHKIHAVKNIISDLEILIQRYDEYKRQNHVIFGNDDKKKLPSRPPKIPTPQPPQPPIISTATANLFRTSDGGGSGGGGGASSSSTRDDSTLATSTNLYGNEFRSRNQRSAPETVSSPSKTRRNYENVDYRSGETSRQLNSFDGSVIGSPSNKHRHGSQDALSSFGRNNQSQRYSTSDNGSQFTKDPRMVVYTRGAGGAESTSSYNANIYGSSGITRSNEQSSGGGGASGMNDFRSGSGMQHKISPSRLASGGGMFPSRNSGGGGGGTATGVGPGTWQRSNNISIFSSLPSTTPSSSYFANPFRSEAAGKAAINNASRGSDNSDNYVFSPYSGFPSRSNY